MMLFHALAQMHSHDCGVYHRDAGQSSSFSPVSASWTTSSDAAGIMMDEIQSLPTDGTRRIANEFGWCIPDICVK